MSAKRFPALKFELHVPADVKGLVLSSSRCSVPSQDDSRQNLRNIFSESLKHDLQSKEPSRLFLNNRYLHQVVPNRAAEILDPLIFCHPEFKALDLDPQIQIPSKGLCTDRQQRHVQDLTFMPGKSIFYTSCANALIAGIAAVDSRCGAADNYAHQPSSKSCKPLPRRPAIRISASVDSYASRLLAPGPPSPTQAAHPSPPSRLPLTDSDDLREPEDRKRTAQKAGLDPRSHPRPSPRAASTPTPQAAAAAAWAAPDPPGPGRAASRISISNLVR